MVAREARLPPQIQSQGLQGANGEDCFVHSSFWRKLPFFLLHIILTLPCHPEVGVAAPASEETPGPARWSVCLEILLPGQLSSSARHIGICSLIHLGGTHHRKSEVEM